MSRYNKPAINPGKDNKSGFPGVFLTKSKGRNGQYKFWYFVGCYTLNGKRKRKFFSTSEYGYEKAKDLAIAFRENGLKQIYDSQYQERIEILKIRKKLQNNT